MRIVIAGDHASPALKSEIAAHLRAAGHEVRDLGTNSSDSVDYPDYAEAACKEVLAGNAERGVLICGTGIGISIAANKIAGIRCGLIWSPETGKLAAEHNHTQVVAIGARVTDAKTAIASVDAWLAATRAEGRHVRRVEKLAALDRKRCG